MSGTRSEKSALAATVRVLPVPQTAPIIVCCLSSYRGMLTHYRKGGSLHCLGESHCPPPAHRQAAIWKGYLCCEQWLEASKVWHPAILELTEGLEHLWRDRQLCGEVWTLSRTQEKGPRSPVLGALLERRSADAIRPPFDMEGTLKIFYHTNYLLLDVPNPVPKKLLLEPSIAPPPVFPLGDTTAKTDEPDAETLRAYFEGLTVEQRRHFPNQCKRLGIPLS